MPRDDGLLSCVGLPPKAIMHTQDNNGGKSPPRRCITESVVVYFFFGASGGGIRPSWVIIFISSM